jgi:CRP/FNR family cyclic AMP-dependent transcriptional regulator
MPKPPLPPLLKADDILLQAIFETGVKRKYGKNEIIRRSDDESAEIFYIRKGYVKVYSLNNRGETYVHLLYTSGEVFPVRWLSGSSLQNLYYEALSDCELLALPKERFASALDASPDLTMATLRRVIEQFAVYVDRLDNLQYKYAQERVIYRLLFLSRRFGIPQADGSCLIDAPISQQVIANSINVSRENVSRELERLQRKGFIKYVNKQIVIQDSASLHSLIPGQLSFSSDD